MYFLKIILIAEKETKISVSVLKASKSKPYSESTLRFCIHYGKNCLIQDGIANVFARFCVCCNLLRNKIEQQSNGRE